MRAKLAVWLLGEAVGAESLDLLEASLGEVALVTICDHAADDLVLERVDVAEAAEAGDGPPHSVGLVGREAVQWTAISIACSWKIGTPKVFCVIHSMALPGILGTGSSPFRRRRYGWTMPPDRAGADDRYLDDEVVETPRPQAREHRHLRPAFDLERPHRVGGTDHVEGLLTIFGH